MSEYKNLSRSTKRRKLLEDLETIDFLLGNQRDVELNFQPSTNSQIIKSLDTENTNITRNITESDNTIFSVNDNTCNVSHNNTLFNINDIFDNGLENVSFSSDSILDDSNYQNDTIADILNYIDDEDLILKSLAKWAVSQNITLSAFSSLLKILKNHKCFKNIPVDARTVLKIWKSNQSNDIKVVPPGLYYHFGIANGLNSLGEFLGNFGDVIQLVIGTDGLPLTKSSSSTFWPILAYARYPSMQYIFLIGLFWGKEKPQSCNDFLTDMVCELKVLYINGMQTPYGKKIVVVDRFCCDSPAKSFILSVKGHSGYSSCTRCTVEGERINNTTCFLGTNFPKTTHINFLNHTDEEHHTTSIIPIITKVPNINIVENFSLDYMHLVCLGVMK